MLRVAFEGKKFYLYRSFEKNFKLDLLILLAMKNKELVLISVLHLSSPKIVQDYVDMIVLNSNMPIPTLVVV